MKPNKLDYTHTLFLKDVFDETLEDLLARIVSYLESMYNKNRIYPKKIAMSQKNYNLINTERPQVIHENRILGMTIEIRKGK